MKLLQSKPPPRPVSPRRKIRNADWDALEIYYRAGYSFRQLASLPEADGVSHQAIAQHADRYGWMRDLSAAAKEEAQRRLALAAYGQSAEAAEGGDAAEPSKEEPAKPAAQLPRTGNKAQDARARAFEAVVQADMRVLERHKAQGDRLGKAWDTIMSMFERYLELDPTDEERARIAATIFNTRDGPADLLTKLTNAHVRVQGTDRTTWDLDGRKSNDIKPILPKVARRGVPGAAKPKPEGSDGAA